MKVAVRNLTFDGTLDAVMEAANDPDFAEIGIPIPFDKFGWFYPVSMPEYARYEVHGVCRLDTFFSTGLTLPFMLCLQSLFVPYWGQLLIYLTYLFQKCI